MIQYVHAALFLLDGVTSVLFSCQVGMSPSSVRSELRSFLQEPPPDLIVREAPLQTKLQQTTAGF